MEYIGIGICAIAVVTICIFIVQRKKNAQEANPNEDVKANAEERGIAVSNDTPTELVIERKCFQQKPSRMRTHFLKLQTARRLLMSTILFRG